jgi:hypothetical protein
VNKVKLGFFSFVEVTSPDAHRSYNEWHQLDHMPEQFPLPGIAWGQRWVATPACQEARLAADPSLAPVHYMALYLMTEPVAETIRDFEDLGSRLAEQGRFHQQRRSHLFGGWHVTEAYAAPRVLISAEAVPFRPHRGVYVIVEEPTGELDGWLQDLHRSWAPAVLEVPGVAGLWSFATTARHRNPAWQTGRTRITVLWLDEPPLSVALDAAVAERWAGGAPVRPLLAGPLETITPWEWTWFDP